MMKGWPTYLILMMYAQSGIVINIGVAWMGFSHLYLVAWLGVTTMMLYDLYSKGAFKDDKPKNGV